MWLVIITVMLGIVIIGMCCMIETSKDLFYVKIQCEGREQEITCWEDEAKQLYIFLPSSVSLDNVRFVKRTEDEILVDGTPMEELKNEVLKLNTRYTVTYTSLGRRTTKYMTIVQSNGVSTLFVTTDSGKTEYLNADKDNKESGTVSIYTSDGKLDFYGRVSSFGGRGNYSWTGYEKKPYKFVLPQEADLLGMGMGSKWILLNNAGDPALMRNKIVYDFAVKIGLEFSPESRWVDVYLNSEYVGLYLLSEDIEISMDRVNVSQTDGSIIAIETEAVSKEKKDTYFITDANVAIEIKSSSRFSGESMARLIGKIQSVENAILSEASMDRLTGKTLDQLIDLDTWAKKYLIDEVFGNLDAFMRSAYFYYSGDSELLYAGPVWDYDLSMGNPNDWRLENPMTLWANRPAGVVNWNTPWIYSLCRKSEFSGLVKELYLDTILPEMEQLLNVKLQEYVSEISDAAVMNKIRWNDNTPLNDAVNHIYEYLKQRIEFLNQIWLEDRDYFVVQACHEQYGWYVYYIVFEGNSIKNLPRFSNTEAVDFLGWYNAKTGELFEPHQPIVEDMEIVAKWKPSSAKRNERIVKLIPLAVIAVIGTILATTELRRWRKYR